MTDSLQQKTFSGFFWTFLETFALQAFAFIQGIILARLLDPSDYGIIAMTGVFFAISSTLIESGFTNALVRKNNCTEKDFSTVFLSNVFLSCVFAIILSCCAPLIAEFYKEPLLIKIVYISSAILVLGAFISVQGIKLTIELNFKTRSIINATAAIITGIATIIMAYMGYGVWSLILPGFLALIIRGVLFWYYQRWFPKFGFSFASYKEFFSYGYKLALSSLVNTLYNNIHPLIIGRCFSATDLGYFTKAKGYAELPSTTVSNIITRVTFPILCKLQDDDVRLANVYRKMLRVSAYVVFPIMFMLAALSRPLVEVLLTHKWAGCIPLLEVLCFSLMWYPIHALNLNLLLVKGRSDLFFRLEIIKKLIGVTTIVATFPFGILWMCVGQVISSVLCLMVNTYYTGRFIHVGFLRQMYDIVPITLFSIIMFISIRISLLLSESYLWQIIIGFIIGCCVYYILSRIAHSQDLDHLTELLKSNIRKNDK